jgi:hypothetical protein
MHHKAELLPNFSDISIDGFEQCHRSRVDFSLKRRWKICDADSTNGKIHLSPEVTYFCYWHAKMRIYTRVKCRKFAVLYALTMSAYLDYR